MLKAQSLLFYGNKRVEVQEENLAPLETGQVLIKTRYSAISAGTELHFYRGLISAGVLADTSLSVLKSRVDYPLKYGYSSVGKIVEVAEGVPKEAKGKLVFCFHPHQTQFVLDQSELIFLPSDMSAEDAVFFSNIESAVNFVMDGKPILGEKVIVLGQGVVGLLTTAILSQFPINKLVTVDREERRRAASLDLGADIALDFRSPDQSSEIINILNDNLEKNNKYPAKAAGSDLLFELTGRPEALNLAIKCTGYDGRIVVGSWYGENGSSVKLGLDFHRKRIKLISSQVSTISPDLTGRWSKKRRFDLVWNVIRKIKPSQIISHRILFHQAQKAYELLDQHPELTVQVILTY
jgi:2-desacetyl-2-hydroxyethyl bacteriochlorophyllide A dehydrogenase